MYIKYEMMSTIFCFMRLRAKIVNPDPYSFALWIPVKVEGPDQDLYQSLSWIRIRNRIPSCFNLSFDWVLFTLI